MTPKERAAMQQALEALNVCVEKFYAMKSTGVIGALPMQAVSAAQAITALREALAEQAEQEPVAIVEVNQMGIPEITWDKFDEYAAGRYELYAAPQPDYKALWEQMCKRCDELDSELAKYTETEPVAYLCNGTRYKVQKLVGDVMICGLPDELIGEWVALVDATDGKHLRAAPVRTKDLTDDDLLEALKSVDSTTARLPQGFKLFARAVIAADREKNNV